MMRGNFNMKPPVLKKNEIDPESLINPYPIYRNCYFEKINTNRGD